MDYSNRFYKTVTLTGKRKLIDQTLNQLHNMQLDMIDQAVMLHDLQQAKDVINFIKEKSK
jgi:hypothetical protein